MACVSFNSYIYFSWYPKYLGAARGIAATEAGLMASAVLAFAAAGTFAGGHILDRVVQRGTVTSRRWLGGVALFSASALLGSALCTQDPWLVALFTALSAFAA